MDPISEKIIKIMEKMKQEKEPKRLKHKDISTKMEKKQEIEKEPKRLKHKDISTKKRKKVKEQDELQIILDLIIEYLEEKKAVVVIL